jgi:hypothetical protein
MRRSRRKELSREERRSLILVFAALAGVCGLATWIHARLHLGLPESELAVRVDSEGIIRAPISKGRVVKVEGSGGGPIRLYIYRSDEGAQQVVVAACRRCNAAKPSQVVQGQLICGYCRRPMPLLRARATLPPEADCTPIPVLHSTDGSFVEVRLSDAEFSQRLIKRGEP